MFPVNGRALVSTPSPSLSPTGFLQDACSIAHSPSHPCNPPRKHKKARKAVPQELVSISAGRAAPSASIKQDESSSVQEASERRKGKTILGPLLSKQVTANCKEPAHTLLQIILCPTSTYSVAQTVGPNIRPFPCHLPSYLPTHLFSLHQLASFLMLKHCCKYHKKNKRTY